MAQNYDLTQTGPELQARIDQVYPNRDAIEQETETREAQDETLEASLKEYTNTEQARAEAAEAQLQSNIDTEQARAETAEGALDTRVSTNEVDIDLLKSQYEALTQSDIIVGPLPSTGQPNKIYRVPGSTYYTDYMWANGGWVKLAEYSTLDGYVYKGIATPSGTPVQSAEAVFYFAVQPGTYTNYGGLVITNTIAILKYNGTEWTKDDVITIDDEPTAGSENLVTSGAVAASVVYDISAANAVGVQLATYADLAAALDGGTNVPVDVRKGGMEIKFVQSSDNKYVQARCMAQSFTTDVTQWQGVDDEPTAGSNNLVKSRGVYELVPYTNSFEKTYNLCDEIFELGQIKSSDGSNIDNPNRIRTVGYIPVTPSTNYRLSCPNDCYIFYYDSNKDYLSYEQGVGVDIVTPSGCAFVRLNPIQDYGTVYNKDIVLCEGTSVKPYIPHFIAKDYVARATNQEVQADIADIEDELKSDLGYKLTSNTYSSTEYYMLSNLNIATGRAFKVCFNITGTFSRIILCANDDNTKRLIDSNNVTITDGKWFDIVAPYNITELGCWLSVGSDSAVGITLDVLGDTTESILKIDKDVQNLVGYIRNSTNATETDYWMMQDLNIEQGQGLYVRFNITGTFSRIILCANTDNTIRLLDSNLNDIIGGVWYYVVAPVPINILGCWLSLPSGSSVQFDIKVLQEIGGQTIKDESLSKDKFVPSIILPTKKLIMQGNGVADTYKVKFRYSDTENMIILFERFGINNFLHPHYIYKETAQELTPNFTNNLTQYLYNGTDWVSPYAYCVATDYSPIENPFTVGGHHGTQGTGGFATMEVTSIDVYADGVKVTDFSNLVYADEIKIVTKSNISACNRINLTTGEKETSFIETVVWTITENNIEVCTYLKAVEAIQIGAYVGLQMSEVYSSGEESVYFNDGHGKYYNNGSQHNSESLPFNGNRMVISKDGVDDIIVVYTNRAVGLGDLSNIGTSQVMYMASFGKCYAHLVQTSNPLVLGIGDVAYYSGGYTFAKSFSCPNAENAYFYKLNGKKVYCVDFLASGDSFVSVPEIEYGKQVEVVKNDNVTIDEIVSGNGIHVKSSGIGNVEFTIK